MDARLMEFCCVCYDMSALTDTVEILLQTNPEQLSVMLHTLSSVTTFLALIITLEILLCERIFSGDYTFAFETVCSFCNLWFLCGYTICNLKYNVSVLIYVFMFSFGAFLWEHMSWCTFCCVDISAAKSRMKNVVLLTQYIGGNSLDRFFEFENAYFHYM